MANLSAQERDALALLQRIAGAREVCDAMLVKVREDEAKAENYPEGGED